MKFVAREILGFLAIYAFVAVFIALGFRRMEKGSGDEGGMKG